MDAHTQITALRKQLRYHNQKYYNEDAPEITDFEYDALQRELRTLKPSTRNTPTPIPRRSASAARPLRNSRKYGTPTHWKAYRTFFSFEELGRIF